MKIAVVGPGAMGCLFAALLRKAKNEVWLLDKNKEKALKLEKQGIIVEAAAGNWQIDIKATADCKDIGQAELIIISVKSYNTKEAVAQSKSLVGENSLVLTLQNGIGNVEVISEVVGADKVIAGSTNIGATLKAVGQVRYAGKGQTFIGKMDGKIPVEMRSIREIFNKAGLDTRISRDIKSILWSKLVINAGINALTAITRLPNGKIIEFDGTRRILREAVNEAVRLAKRKKIKLIYDDPLAKVEAVCEATATNISSTLQDVLKKKPTEIDFINGVIVRQAQSAGISVPVNSLLADLVKAIELSYDLRVG